MAIRKSRIQDGELFRDTSTEGHIREIQWNYSQASGRGKIAHSELEEDSSQAAAILNVNLRLVH